MASRVTEMFERLRKLSEVVALEQGLKLLSIERGEKKARGRCFGNGKILIRMHTSKYMEDKAMLQENARTFAHELAHLKHMHHDVEFWDYEDKLIDIFSERLGLKIPYE